MVIVVMPLLAQFAGQLNSSGLIFFEQIYDKYGEKKIIEEVFSMYGQVLDCTGDVVLHWRSGCSHGSSFLIPDFC